MNYEFRTLSLPKASTYNSLKLAQLAQQLEDPTLFNQLQQLPETEIGELRTLDEIFQAIENLQADQIKPIEWVYCLHSKAQWDLDHPSRSLQTSESIWNIALSNPWLKQSLFCLLFFEHSRSEQILASSFTETFSYFVKRATGADKSIIEVISAIAKQDYRTLTRISANQNLTPQELLKQLQLPRDRVIVQEAHNQVVNVFATQSQPEWLLRCFEEMSSEQQVQQVQLLLKCVSAKTGSNSPSLMDWLQKNYGRRTQRWHSLSSSAKSALLEWLNAATWGDFERVVDVLLSRLDQRLHNAMPESERYKQLRYQTNQLRMRKGFWSNYSQRFERFRILLPQESASWLSQELKRDIDVLTPDGSEETEVCIFDFGDWYVVEFFRGAGSEMRLFNRQQNPQIEQKLFINSGLSVKRLRCLGGEAHDHVYLWQVYAERWLREHGIYPNSGITRFQGLDPRFNQYSLITGLKTPDISKQRQRERKLKNWQSDIKELEAEAKAYCNLYGN